MKRFYFLLLTAVIAIGNLLDLSAQSFSISEIDASNFPNVSSHFVALEYNGESIGSFEPSDFSVIENDKDLSSTISIDCIDSLDDPPLNICLVLDQSNSMNILSESGEPYSAWVREGATSFINALNFENGTQVEIIGFAQTARVLRSFTNNKASLLQTINNLTFAGGTYYNPPLLDSTKGAISRLRYNTSPDVRRVIVFLTDGDPDSQFTTATYEIINNANVANIQIYAITLNMAMNFDLRTIAENTGGKAFPVFTKAELNNVYAQIANDIKRKKICKINWVSPYGCSSNDFERKVTITYNKFTKSVKSQYTAPSNSLADITISPTIQFFDDPDVGVYVDKNISITPQNTDIEISSGSITPNTFFSVIDWDAKGNSITKPPFTIKRGTTHTITVRFTAKELKTYRKASLTLNSTPCPLLIDLVGGLSQVNIVSPNGGEIFSTCDYIDIKWGGIKATTPINLYYSTGNGNWTLIASNLTGLSYRWKPNFSSQTIKVKAVVQTSNETMWLKSFGSAEDDIVTGLAIHPNNSYIYVCGYYNGKMQIDQEEVPHAKLTDAFIAQFTTDGTMTWIRRIYGTGNEKISSLCTDAEGNVYITGTAFQGSVFDNYAPTSTSSQNSYAFVTKYNTDGLRVRLHYIAADAVHSSFMSEGTYVTYLPDVNKIRIQGNYKNEITVNNKTLPKTGTRFQALYSSDLYLEDLRTGWFNSANRTSLSGFDSEGNKYTAENYSNSIKKGTYSRNSNGNKDIAIYKEGSTKSTEDESDLTFQVSNIDLRFTMNSIDIGNCNIGDNRSETFSGIIKNFGDITGYVTKQELRGNSDFKIITDFTSEGILPNESKVVVIEFSPLDKGTRSATLSLDVECANSISIPIYGYGSCLYSAIDTVTFPKTAINKDNEQEFEAVFNNPNSIAIEITPEIIGADASYFSIIEPSSPYLVPANSNIAFKIKFSPTEEREYTAQIIYNLPQECTGEDVTEIIGHGVNGDLLVSGCKFGAVRKMTVNSNDETGNPASITIHNSSDFPAVITSIAFANASKANSVKFELLNIPALPYQLAGNADLNIPVRFTPQGEDIYSAEIAVRIEGKDKEFTTEVSGEGWMPKYSFVWECPPPVNVGEESVGTLSVTSTDTKIGLNIHNIEFNSANSAYSFLDSINDIKLSVGETKTFNIKFRPTTPGISSDNFTLSTDAAPGPELNPSIDTTYAVNCEVLGVQIGEGIEFGNLLICDATSGSIEVKNVSSSTPLVIKSGRIENNSDGVFSIMPIENISIAPNGLFSLTVNFAPVEAKSYSATLILTTKADEELSFPLAGSAADFSIYSPISEYSEKPGNTIQIPINAEIPHFTNSAIHNMKIRFKCHPKMVLPIGTSDDSWKITKLANGEYELTFAGLINTPFDGELLKVKAKIYLADTIKSDITLRPYFNECEGSDTLIAVLGLTGVCNINYTKLEFSGSDTDIEKIAPNPAYTTVKITYSLAISAPVKMELFNMMGELIDIPLDQSMDSGVYEMNYDLHNFGNGQYYLRLTQGNTVIVKPLLIAK